jgi:hypothetical protein
MLATRQRALKDASALAETARPLVCVCVVLSILAEYWAALRKEKGQR